MIHVDALDFSEWHSEEVIRFFWRSVYILGHKLDIFMAYQSQNVQKTDWSYNLQSKPIQ